MSSDATGRPLEGPLLHRLERLHLASRRRLATHGKGERRSLARGTSVEFADYRGYSAGDDPRQVDWNIYGRTGGLFVKLFEDEQVLTVHLLLDVSRSMDWGEPNKLAFATRLAAGLGYVALNGYDRLLVSTIDRGVVRGHGPVWGRPQVAGLFGFLARSEAAGPTDLAAALDRHTAAQRQPGLAILISDLLTPTVEAGLHQLLRRRYEVVLLHLLAPQEIDPPAGEELRLIDRESGRVVEVNLDRRALDLYRRHFQEWCGALENLAARQGITYLRLSSGSPIEEVLLTRLPQRGVLR